MGVVRSFFVTVWGRNRALLLLDESSITLYANDDSIHVCGLVFYGTFTITSRSTKNNAESPSKANVIVGRTNH